MGTLTATHLVTAEEYALLPDRDDFLHDELIEGEVILSPHVKHNHTTIVMNLGKLLRALESDYVLPVDFGWHLDKYSVPAPDLAIVGALRWADTPGTSWLQASPAVVVEVYSPSDRKALMPTKVHLYLQHGALAVWVIYPKRRTVVVHTVEQTAEFRPGESFSLPDSLPRLTLQVDDVFSAVEA